MVRLTVLTLSSLLALSVLPAHAQTPGDIIQGVGRAMNGEPPPAYRAYDWRDQERERAYRREQRRLDAEQRELDVRRRALHDQRHYNEENGFYGR